MTDGARVRDPARVPRRRDPEATRARILMAATREFARNGYAGARGDRIALQARCSERMVYYYFGNKDGLYRDVLEGVYESLRRAEQSLDLDRLEPRAALIEFCRFVWRYYLEHPEFIGLVNSENLQQARHLRTSTKLDQLVSPVVGMLEVLLLRGRTSGVFREGIDANELYLAIAALGYFYLSNTHTLSAVLGRDLRAPAQLEQHWRQSALIVERAVCIDAA